MVLLESSNLELEDLRRRERELAALFEIASELSVSMRDSDQVLRLIVKWTRRLLGTDLAYISVPEPDGVHARIRVVDGNTTTAFAQLRLKLGTGLGGVVAATRMPYASRETRSDPEIIHDDQYLYGVAQEEGIVAVVGVPLIRGKVIGVLYAAHRVARSYSRNEVALLSTLADHAVVALNNAYLFEEADASISALRQVRDELAAKNAATRRLAELDDVLIATMLEDETVERLAATLAEFTDCAIAIVDERGKALATGGGGTAALAAAASAVELSAADAGAVAVELDDGSGAIVAPLGTGAEGRGCLNCAGRDASLAVDPALVERAALVTQRQLVH
ncbi:MAG: GAF domain-containing protein, partial [Solirubrobacterales bacterium]